MILESVCPWGGLIDYSNYEYRIYGDAKCSIWAIVDEEDYQYFCQWCWNAIPNSTGKKLYLRRTLGGGGTPSFQLYLHVAIQLRTGIQPPTLKHTMVDHIDSDSLNCRRDNLRWATPQMNRWNRMGQRELRL